MEIVWKFVGFAYLLVTSVVGSFLLFYGLVKGLLLYCVLGIAFYLCFVIGLKILGK